MQVTPYLFFDGQCEQAVAFYQETLGAQAGRMMRFKEHPDAGQPGQVPAGSEEKIMHGEVLIGDTRVLVSDGRCQGRAEFKGFSLTLTLSDAAEAEGIFNALSEGGEVRMPLEQTFFSPCFGMVADKFGVTWMILVQSGQA